MLKSSRESIEVCKRLRDGAAQCQLFKFDSISALSYWIFNTIGLARTSQEYHKRFLRTDKKLQFLHKFHQNVIQYLKNQTDFWRFYHSISIFSVNRCWFKHCSYSVLGSHSMLIRCIEISCSTTER